MCERREKEREMWRKREVEELEYTFSAEEIEVVIWTMCQNDYVEMRCREGETDIERWDIEEGE